MNGNGKQVMIENVGPIERLSIPLPESGVVVLRGRNGVGKSHALEAVDSLLTKRGRPVCRDHAKRGVVEGFGARMTIGRSTRRTGEAEVLTLEGKLDISQLVDPGLKDPESADRTRIKALIQLSGATVDPSAFASLVPDDTPLEKLVSEGGLDTDDPVVLAGRIKRALESEARRHESAAKESLAKARTYQDEAGEWDKETLELKREQTEAELQKALVRLRELQTRAEQAAAAIQRTEEARKKLERIRSSVPEDQSLDALESEVSELDVKISRLEQALAVARERRTQLGKQIDQQRQRQAEIAELEQIIEAAGPEPVPLEEIHEAEQRVDAARQTHALAIKVEQAWDLVTKADECRRQAHNCEQQAGAFRDAARATDDVLSDLVGKVTSKLRVDGGRLVTDTDRGAEPFSELSPGERWRIALEIAAEQVGHGGLVTVPQEAWESLDPVNRAEIGEIARSVGVTILTAEATDDAALAVAQA